MKRKHLPVRIQSHGSCLPRIAAFLLTALLSCISTMTCAFDFSAENGDGVTIYYNYINDNKEVEVTFRDYYDSYSGTVNIPKTVTHDTTTINVTSIGGNAFSNCSSLTSVTIPNSVTNIDGMAFSGCSRLTSVTIPNSVTSIGDRAFSSCSKLTSITIPNSVTSIGENAFSSCSNLTSITIPNSVTSIGEYAFRECSSLTSINIPNSVTSIGDGAFSSCSSLTSINIPGSVKSIGDRTFFFCSRLTSINIPNSVTSIGVMAFRECSSLIEVSLQGTTLPTTSEVAFYRTDLTNVTLYCKPALVETCKNTAPWKDFGKISTSAPTGIAPVKTVEEETNGNTVIYNINGQRMQSLTRGLNIVNGKKIFIK